MAEPVRKRVTKVWLNGTWLPITSSAEFEGELDSMGQVGVGPWKVRAQIPPGAPPWREMMVAAELEDGVIVRGRCRLAWTPDDPDLWLFEGIERPERS